MLSRNIDRKIVTKTGMDGLLKLDDDTIDKKSKISTVSLMSASPSNLSRMLWLPLDCTSYQWTNVVGRIITKSRPAT